MPSALHPRHRWWTLAAVSLTQLLIVLDGTIVNVALPRAQAELGFDDSTRQWVVTAYALAFGSFLLLGGRVADYWGRKRTFLTAITLFALGSAWGGLTADTAGLLAARGVQGFAAAFLAPAALSIVTTTFPAGRERNRAFAIFGSLAGAGAAIGMLLGGLLTEFLSWRWCLLVNVPVAVGILVAGAILLGESRAEGQPRYDVAGAVTATLGFGSLVYGLTLAEKSWVAPETLAFVGAGGVLLIAFLVIEHNVAHPLLPLRVVRHPTRGSAFALQALLGAAGLAVMLHLAFHLQLVLDLPPLLAGLGTLPFTASLMATVPFALRLVDRVGPRRQLIFGPLISALGTLALTQITPTGSYWTHVLPGVVLLGVGMGFTVVPLQSLALMGVDPGDAGVAVAASNASNQLGGSIGLALLTVVYVSVAGGAASDPTALVAGYAAVFAVCTAILVASSGLAWGFVRLAQAEWLPETDPNDLVDDVVAR